MNKTLSPADRRKKSVKSDVGGLTAPVFFVKVHATFHRAADTRHKKTRLLHLTVNSRAPQFGDFKEKQWHLFRLCSPVKVRPPSIFFYIFFFPVMPASRPQHSRPFLTFH
ncbi:hypothetical protein [Pantoea sp. 1.19]|uniref:hypothetical protein n=1 Tax=Pantoea sp. 1.19 TaxID=1925589 RepID=UPI0011152899|nr:hypothetical protein [Pantoea sp. 1.19]